MGAMAYERPKNGRRYIAVDIGNGIMTCGGQVSCRVPQSYEKSRARAGKLASAEMDFFVRRDILNEHCSKLVLAAEAGFREQYFDGIDLPSDVTSYTLLKDEESRRNAYRVEALIGMYLDGYYIVMERLWAATDALSKESSGAAWSDLKKQRLSADGSKLPVNDNLVAMFEADGHAAAAKRVREAIGTRNARVHIHHLEVNMEQCPDDGHPVIIYTEENSKLPEPHGLIFNDRQRAEWSNALMALLKWWHDRTFDMLGIKV